MACSCSFTDFIQVSYTAGRSFNRWFVDSPLESRTVRQTFILIIVGQITADAVADYHQHHGSGTIKLLNATGSVQTINWRCSAERQAKSLIHRLRARPVLMTGLSLLVRCYRKNTTVGLCRSSMKWSANKAPSRSFSSSLLFVFFLCLRRGNENGEGRASIHHSTLVLFPIFASVRVALLTICVSMSRNPIFSQYLSSFMCGGPWTSWVVRRWVSLVWYRSRCWLYRRANVNRRTKNSCKAQHTALITTAMTTAIMTLSIGHGRPIASTGWTEEDKTVV